MAVLVPLSFLATNYANGQELIPDFRTDGSSPPVHIPPRKPIYDPGLPDTLNGKFNSVQNIRSSSTTGQRVNINDHSESGYRGQSNSYPEMNRRRGGFQDRIANLMTRNGSAAQAVSSNNGQKWQSNLDGIVRNTRTPNPSDVVRPRQNNSMQTAVNRFSQRTEARQRQPQQANYQDQVQSQPHIRQQPTQQNRQQQVQTRRQVSNSNLHLQTIQQNNSNQSRQRTRTATPPKPNVRTASLQQIDGERGQFNTGVQSRDQFVSPRVQGQAFRSNPNLKPSNLVRQEAQLPVAKKSIIRKAAPVSVLNESSENSFDTSNIEFEGQGEIVLSSPEPSEPIDLFEPENSSSEFNMLRSENRLQDEEAALGSDLDDAEFSDDLEDSDTEQTDPLRKSCEDFRRELLNSSITDIALDISPPGKTDSFGDNEFRTWRDQYGNELAQGTIADLRRGYLLVDSASGGQVRLPYARLCDSDWLAISDYWRLPSDCGLGSEMHPGRCWSPQTSTWYASNACHKPLYFEHVQLERYGHSHGPFVQPVASTVHFFGKLFFLPYNTAINPPNECQYALGFYRPGNCAPWLKDPFPISLSGASRQSLIYTGVGFLAD